DGRCVDVQDLYELVRSYCVRHLSLVARCAAFRALSPMEQQSILLIAQEGICAGLAMGAVDGATSRQPGAAAVSDNSGTRSSAAWVISLSNAPAASTPPATSRPRRQQTVRAGGGDSRQPPQLQSVASAPPAVSPAPAPSAAASSLAPSAAAAAAAPQLRTAERAARRSISLRQATGSSSSNATAAAAAVVQPLKPNHQSGAAVAAGVIDSRPVSMAVVTSPLRRGTSQGRLSVEARPSSRRSRSLMSEKDSTGSDGGLGSLAASIDAASLAGLLVPDAGTESPAAVALVAVAVTGSGTDGSSIHVQGDVEEESFEAQMAAVQTSKAATLAAMEGGVDEATKHTAELNPEQSSGGNDNRGGSCVGDDSIPGASPAQADASLATVSDGGFGAAPRTEAGAAVQLQVAGPKAEGMSKDMPEEVSGTVAEVKDDGQPAAAAETLIGTGVEVGSGGAEVKTEESEAARLHVEPELEVVYGAEAGLPACGLQGSPSARIGEDGVEAGTSAKEGDGAPEAPALSGTRPAKDGDGAVASLGDATKGRGSFRSSWIGAGPDDPGSTLPLAPLPPVPLPAGAGVLRPLSDFDYLMGDGGVGSQPPTPARRESVGLLGSRPTEVQDHGNGVDPSGGGGGTSGGDCSSENVAGSASQVEPPTTATDYPKTSSTEDSAVNAGVQDRAEIGSNSAVTAAACTFAAAAAAAAGNSSVADDTRHPQADASGAAVRASAAANTVAANTATAVVAVASAARGSQSARGCSSTATVGCARIRTDSGAKQSAAGRVSERSRSNRVPVAMVGMAPVGFNDHSSGGGNAAHGSAARSGAGTKPAAQRWVYGTATRSTTTAATFSTANEVKAYGTPGRRSTLTANGADVAATAATTATTATTTARSASRTAVAVRSRQDAVDPASSAVAAPSNRRTVPCTRGASATTADSCHLPNHTAAPPSRAVRRAPVGDGVESAVEVGMSDGGTGGTAELRKAGAPAPRPRAMSARGSPPLATATRPRALSARNPLAGEAARQIANPATLGPQLPQPRPVGSRGAQAAATVKRSIASATSVKSPTAQRRSMPSSASARSSRRGGGFTTGATSPTGDMAV
ncbi:hypothetical protein Vretifemale_14395, partial [Volvox reticuliferus]